MAFHILSFAFLGKDSMAFTKSEPEQTPETLENKRVSSISDTPETLTYKTIKHNYLYYYIVPTSYNHFVIKSLLQEIIYYGEDSSINGCSKIVFKSSFKSTSSIEKIVDICYNKEKDKIHYISIGFD